MRELETPEQAGVLSGIEGVGDSVHMDTGR